MKIAMTIRPTYENEIQFHDACMGAAVLLTALAERALCTGDHAQFVGTRHVVHAENDDAEDIGTLTITE